MIQCEECGIWQHRTCVGLEKEENSPANYFCDQCAPSDRGRKLGHQSELPEKDLHMHQKDSLQEDDIQQQESSRKWERDCTPPPYSAALPETSLSAPDDEISDNGDQGLEVELPTPLTDIRSSPSARNYCSSPSKRNTSSPSSSSAYAASRHWLTQANASPLNRPTPSHPLLTPTKSSKKKDEVTCLVAPQGSASELDPSTVPLPDHYLALLSLHSAVERALLLHLATEGSRACGVAAMVQASSTDFVIDLPNLVSYSTIRSVVERGSGKRFGPTELGQLVWLWEGGLHGPQATEGSLAENESLEADRSHIKKKRGGLSITVNASRQLEKTTGKKVYTWGLGIDLQIKQNVQLPAFEVLANESPLSSSSRSRLATPPQSPGGKAMKRHGMSIMPLWSSRSESRKEEMRRRLGECVLKAHDNFASYCSATLSTSACTKGLLTTSIGLPTPPPSTAKYRRSGPKSLKDSIHHQSIFKKGFILDALPPIPSSSLPPLGPVMSSPLKPAITTTTTPNPIRSIATVEAEIARADTDITARKRKILEEGKLEHEAPKAPTKQRAMSLLERVRPRSDAMTCCWPSDTMSL